MTPDGETWQSAAVPQPIASRSMRTHMRTPARYGGTSHTPSEVRMASAPAFNFSAMWHACPKSPRVLIPRDDLIALHAGEEGWLTVPTLDLQVGQGFRVLDTHGLSMLLIKRVALRAHDPVAFTSFSSSRASLLAHGALPPEPEFLEGAGVYMQFGNRGLAGECLAPHTSAQQLTAPSI